MPIPRPRPAFRAAGPAARVLPAALVLLGGGQAAVPAVATAQSGVPAPAAAVRRPIRLDDLSRLRTVGDPQLSPDGAWVAYTVSVVDTARDKANSDIWMTSWDGAQTVRVTYTGESETTPRWSPDGRWLAFLSGRDEGKGAQVWLLDRRGGEAQRVTMIRDGVSDLAWAPDGKRLVLVAGINLDTVAAKRDTSKAWPIVIDRYHFKEDIDGYLETTHDHLLLFDVDTRRVDTLTTGAVDDGDPRWSPDGTRIAFVRHVPPEPGTGEESDIHVVDAKPAARPVQLTTTRGPDTGPPSWSPDGQWVAFLRTDDPKYYAYQQEKLAVVRSDASAPARVVSAALDRAVYNPEFAPDGQSVYAMIPDDRQAALVRIRVADGHADRLVDGRRLVYDFSTATSAPARVAMLLATPDRPAEIWALAGDTVRQLSHQNDALMTELVTAPVEGLTSRSADGTEVHSIVVRPAGVAPGTRLPTIFFIHGGPKGQNDYGFTFEHQFFAAHGYAVVSVNYRGSEGRGLAYQRAIFADWGHKEVLDILGAVDEAVKEGIADPDRLAIGGWSYGGILTDYTIATTTRFKAAVSGAGSGLQLSMFGVDEYAEQYELELGAPWKNPDLWKKLSYPYFDSPKIVTPTLFLGGSSDFNVPIVGGEQMYQALRLNGVPTQLVIYPNQFHSLTVPSFRADYRRRFLAWVDRYLKPPPPKP
ncbi:MAG TPA: S9 family peptidase, partial [Gemmatimonadaceae bacterium]|nr:S9 family peptidase [Gemmatimonadaceae bacterium]